MVVPNKVGRVVIAQLLDPHKDNNRQTLVFFQLVGWMGSGELKTDTSTEDSIPIIFSLRSQHFLYTVHRVDEKVKSTPHKLRKRKLKIFTQ